MTERPVTFENRRGYRLFGMLYIAEPEICRRTVVVISVNAIKYRAGTFRMHVLMARHLALLGYTVFTFDPQGVGDSEGTFECKLLSEHYYDIQTGKYDEDLRDAITFVLFETRYSALVLCGLCGGAISVLMAGASDPRVNGIALLNVPVLVEDLLRRGAEDNAAKITSTQVARKLLSQKLIRLIETAFWKRVIARNVNFREEWSLVKRGVSVFLRQFSYRLSRSLRKAVLRSEPSQQMSQHRLYSLHFHQAFVAAKARGVRLLLLFAEHDPWTWIFRSEVIEIHPNAIVGQNIELHTVAGANHVFSAPESQRALCDAMARWLEQK